MKITKSELREMIRETLREELSKIESSSTVVTTDLEHEVLDESLEESTLENIFEGIFDSKETKQKAYTEKITNTFKKAPAAVAAEVAGKAIDALQETIDAFDDDNSATFKAAAKNLINALVSAKVGAQKNQYGILNSIIAYVQKYNRNAVNLDDLVEFKRVANQIQSREKDGAKAIAFLLEMVNKQMATKIDSTIAFLKKEYAII